MRSMPTQALPLAACAAIFLLNPDMASGQGDDCAASGEREYVRGPRNAEDIVRLGSSDWLIVSGSTASADPEIAWIGCVVLPRP